MLPESEIARVLQGHPRIGARKRSLSSSREQCAVWVDDDAVMRTLDEASVVYEERFGFRYVVYVAGRPRSAIVPLLRTALDAEPDDERIRGLTDVVAIARARATDLGMEEDR